MTVQGFYKPRPIAPEDNRQMRGLRWSLRVSVAGWIVYGAFAYAFADVDIIPSAVLKAAVIIGSILIVAGAESNTIATTEAALSKIGTPRISKWDFAAVIASLIGGICTALITFASRQVVLSGPWRDLAIEWGPLVLGLAGVLDFYGAVTELALAKRDYVLDLGEWLVEQHRWNDEHGIVEAPIVRESPTLSFDPSWAQAGIDDVRAIAAQMNGQRRTLTEEQLLSVLHQNHLRPREAKTVKRWVRTVREEAK